LIFGNGGSAADSLHFSAELVGKFLKDRDALNVICLNSNQATITAWSNDFSFDSVFERQIMAHGKKNGVAIAITTSGKSKNVLLGIKKANQIGMGTIALTGNNKYLDDKVDVCISVPSNETPVIQECHVIIYHYICMRVEEDLFG